MEGKVQTQLWNFWRKKTNEILEFMQRYSNENTIKEHVYIVSKCSIH